MKGLRKIPFLLLFMLIATATLAAGPSTISYQGSLTDSGGAAVTDGTYDMRFAIFDAPSGGSQLWQETQNSVPVAGGLFSVELGSATALPASIYDTANLYLEIEVDLSGNSTFETNEKYSPRQHITSAAFARNADKVDSLAAAQFLRSDVDDTATSHIIFNDGLSWGAKEGHVMVSPYAFMPEDEGYNYHVSIFGLGKDETGNTGYGAPVTLPHGATLTAMRVWYRDTVAENLNVKLHVWEPDMGSQSWVFEVSSSGSAGIGYADDTTPVASLATVDNENRVYQLRLTFASAFNSNDLELRAVRISYTTTGP